MDRCMCNLKGERNDREVGRGVPVALARAGWKQSNIPTHCRRPANSVPVGREGGREGGKEAGVNEVRSAQLRFV